MSAGKEPSRALPVGMYRDPADFVKLACETSCAGCRHEVKAWGKVACELKRPHSANGGKKCKRFKAGEGTK